MRKLCVKLKIMQEHFEAQDYVWILREILAYTVLKLQETQSSKQGKTGVPGEKTPDYVFRRKSITSSILFSLFLISSISRSVHRTLFFSTMTLSCKIYQYLRSAIFSLTRSVAVLRFAIFWRFLKRFDSLSYMQFFFKNICWCWSLSVRRESGIVVWDVAVVVRAARSFSLFLGIAQI